MNDAILLVMQAIDDLAITYLIGQHQKAITGEHHVDYASLQQLCKYGYVNGKVSPIVMRLKKLQVPQVCDCMCWIL